MLRICMKKSYVNNLAFDKIDLPGDFVLMVA
jgi:hypothetical protein